jgi:hypothetical protein
LSLPGCTKFSAIGINSCGLILAVLTTLLFEYFPSHEKTGDPLLINGDFLAITEGWHFSKDLRTTPGYLADGLLELRNDSPGRDLLARQNFSIPDSRQIILTGYGIELAGTEQGENPKEVPTIAVVGRSTKGNMIGGSDYILFRESGTRSFDELAKVITIPIHFLEARIEAEFVGGTGLFRVDRLSAFEAKKIKLHDYGRYGLLLAWSILWLITGMTLLKLSLTAALGFVTLLGLLIFLPESLKVEILAPADALLKIGSFDHLALFILGTIGVRLLFPIANPGLLLFSIITFATASETLQYFTSHREPLVLDWVFNQIGILIGFSLITAIRQIRAP